VKVDGTHRRTLWPAATCDELFVIDQRQLPHHVAVERLGSVDAVFAAIHDMWVRGAPLIGATAAYGIALQANADATDPALHAAATRLAVARPTAVNLAWALQRMLRRLLALPPAQRAAAAWREAAEIADEDVRTNQAIGRHGLRLIADLAARHGRRINLLTHCNAGWLATVDWGTALAPVYQAQVAGIEVHVWVDETRPRNQGAALTAWELAQQGVPCTLVADNAGGHLMQHGQVDLVLVGCDRVSANGDVCNKVGTYLKALAAQANDVPFYVAMPLSTLDLSLHEGLREIPIEQRSPRELTHVWGRSAGGELVEVQIAPAGCEAANPAFDVTPAALVSALITERGVVRCAPDSLWSLAGAQA
jgi:methylthioribose-1-phosphate isomerase